ncbi:MAG: ATP-binding protein [Oscillospiraceae bacterium]|jgi:DNA replication protein DnaC|nr:ATP-binding protein [Oscillospiraceae bacterium]
MSTDGRLLFNAREALAERRRERERELHRREAEVTARVPRARELQAALRETMADLLSAALDRNTSPARLEDIERRNLDLQERLFRAMEASGYPRGYLDGAPACEVCGDKGYVGTAPCACLMELYRAEQKKALSSLLKLGNERFESFDLTYYDASPDAETGVSPREHMRFVFNMCEGYARGFGKGSYNLYFCGAPGLGKTFLAACVARVVAERGHSVVYEPFTAIFAKLEDEKFSRGEDTERTRAETKRFRECDLLIADDLGMEMQTSFTTAALYELINTRLITGKKTIITSNLGVEELRRRYTPQITSRLEGEYQVLPFYGSDIRALKKERGSL